MSLSYASRLKEYHKKGVCGLAESQDTARSLGNKVNTLAQMVRESNRIVFLTGAGISTAAGIPDFRGPQGIWTRELETKESNNLKLKRKRVENGDSIKDQPPTSESKTPGLVNEIENEGHDMDKRRRINVYPESDQAVEKQIAIPEVEVEMDFVQAQPTLTHRAITYLVDQGIVNYVVTQNVDGLHRRSGLSRSRHCSLHGCVFTEVCRSCDIEYFRDFDVGGMSFQKTGRYCDFCKDELRDTLLDWEDGLPEKDFERSQQECRNADLVICLGTSLRIQPVNTLPCMAKKFVIVNLQKTPLDDKASLVIRGKVDSVMSMLMSELRLTGWETIPTPSIERSWNIT